jgi:hypothetical protein
MSGGWLACSSGVKVADLLAPKPLDATSRRCGGTLRTNRSVTGKPVN